MYYVKKTTKPGYTYLYAQESWREGGKVRTRSRSLGRVGGGGMSVDTRDRKKRKEDAEEFARGMASLEKENQALAEEQRRRFGETGEERAERLKGEEFSPADFLKDTEEPPNSK